ncbi:MAG: hypothetical protein RLZZ543_767 [Bacteroidota bacterium]|jgi:shikimate kinase
MHKPLFICGMPGSGKSGLGKRLANRMLWSFVDLDQLIEQRCGKSPAVLITELGEAAFRQMEAEALRSLSSKTNTVIACGGGTPCFLGNLEWMQSQGIVLFIDMPLKSIMQRLLQSKGQAKRPLLGNGEAELAQRLEMIWQQREAYFKQIDWWINGLHIDLEALALELKQRIASV